MNMFESIISIVGGMCGILSVVFCVVNFKRENNGYLSDFISFSKDKDFIKAKINIYELGNCEKDEYFIQCENIKEDISYFCNFFNNAGILVYKKRLPFWVFTKGGWGYITVKTFKILENYIERERSLHNEHHCYYFEYLYNKINRQ